MLKKALVILCLVCVSLSANATGDKPRIIIKF
jgi:hypothetical protein